MKSSIHDDMVHMDIHQVGVKKVRKARMYLSFLLILSLSAYIVMPKQSEVLMIVFYAIFALMSLSLYIYFKAKKKANYLEFDTIFILVYCLVGFSTTFVYNDELLFKAVFLGFPVEEDYINISNLLFLIGLQSYLIGSLREIPIQNNTQTEHKIIKTYILSIAIFILCVAFVASGGITYYKSVYDTSLDSEGPGISKHILLLLVSASITAIATEFYNKKICTSYRLNPFLISLIIFVVLLLLWAGNRTAASQLLLPMICLYTILFRNVSFKCFFGLAFVGIFLMWGVQNLRSNEGFNLTSPILMISDLTIPARTTYSALDYSEENGYTYGKSMSMGVIGVIPFIPSLVSDNEGLTPSAELLTDYTFDVYKTPKQFQIGLGTTIIGDIFLSFGLIGVVLLMFLLGYLVNRYTVRSLSLNYYSMVILGGLLANAIFLVRASYTHPVRYILWALFIAYLNRMLLLKWKK